LPAALAVGFVVVVPIAVRAQGYEDVGTRAQGMAGAFVAVADDATASWWNPAGLASGAYFNVIFEKGRAHEPEDPSGFDPARRTGTTGFAVAFPALGVSYYRMRVSEIAGSSSTTASASENREELGGASGLVRSRSVSQFGLTIGQSLGKHLVVGSTLKLLRAGAAATAVGGESDALDVGDDLKISRRTRTDLDVGVMASFQHLRIGLSVRNLTQPEFGEGDDRLILERQARAGIALLAASQGTVSGLTVAADLDLTRQATPFGDSRRAAVGGEAKLGRRLAVRGGLGRNTLDDRGLTKTTGVSVALVSGIYIEGARAFGADESMRGWSSTVRLTF
jgi:hypothetical protein